MFSKIGPLTKTGSPAELRNLILARMTDHYRARHMSYTTAVARWVKNRHVRYRVIAFSDLKRLYKKSDTLFVMGSGPSLSDLTPQQLEEVRRHDVFGVNFSFLKEEILPTYQVTSWEADEPVFGACMDHNFSRHRHRLRDTVFLQHDKDFLRFLTPRLMPEKFPKSPTVCFYLLPHSINLEEGKDFQDEDFDRSLFYRGTGSLVIHMGVQLGYRRIVLLGFDPNTVHHFFDNIPSMEPYCRRFYERCQEKGLQQLESMIPRGTKSQPVDHYYWRVAEYLRKKRHVELMVDTPKSIFYPEIPAYFA